MGAVFAVIGEPSATAQNPELKVIMAACIGIALITLGTQIAGQWLYWSVIEAKTWLKMLLLFAGPPLCVVMFAALALLGVFEKT